MDALHATQPASTDDAMKNKNINNNDNGSNAMPVHDKVTRNEQDDERPDCNQPAAATASAATTQIQDITDRALRFFSQASNETLGACLVALSATTYFILGRVGLLLIGIVGGIALHATWDSAHSSADRLGAKDTEQKKRREIGLEVVQRVLQWNEKKADGSAAEGSDDEVKPVINRKADFSSFRPDTAAALNHFTDAIIRDYVKYVIL